MFYWKRGLVKDACLSKSKQGIIENIVESYLLQIIIRNVF